MISRKETYEYTDVANLLLSGKSYTQASPYLSREQMAWLNECVRTGTIRDSFVPQKYRCTYQTSSTKKDNVGILPSRANLSDYKEKIGDILTKKVLNDFGEHKVIYDMITADATVPIPTRDELKTLYGQFDFGEFDGELGLTYTQKISSEFARTCRLVSNGVLIRSSVQDCTLMADIVNTTSYYSVKKEGSLESSVTPLDDFRAGNIYFLPQGWMSDYEQVKFYYRQQFLNNPFQIVPYDYRYFERDQNASYTIASKPWRNAEMPSTESRVECTMIYRVHYQQHFYANYNDPQNPAITEIMFPSYQRYMVVSEPLTVFQARESGFRLINTPDYIGDYICDKYNLFGSPQMTKWQIPQGLDEKYVVKNSVVQLGQDLRVIPIYACLQARSNTRDLGT